MACKTVYLADRSRSLLYDKLMDSFDDKYKGVAINAYHNINSISGDLLFNDKTLRDRNGEPLPLYSIITQEDRAKIADLVQNPDIYHEVYYTTKPNGNEPVFVNSKQGIDLSEPNAIHLNKEDTIINLKDLETTTEIEGASYDTEWSNNFKSVSGQKKASDFNKVLNKKRIGVIEFNQSIDESIDIKSSKTILNIDF